MREMVEVGKLAIIGEIIRMEGDEALIQVYEDTQGLRLGEDVSGNGEPLSMALGPGLIGTIIDGIGRPLGKLRELEGSFISRGVKVDQLDLDKVWEITPQVSAGEIVTSGMVLATVQESSMVTHRIVAPPGVEGEILSIVPAGFHKAGEILARIRDGKGKAEGYPDHFKMACKDSKAIP